MRPNASALAMRDPALAALLGVHGGNANFGSEFGADYSEFGVEFGAPEFGSEFGDDPAAPVTQAQALAAVQMVRASQRASAQRNSLLEPNKGSSIKVERYTFGIGQTVVLGTAAAVTASDSPNVTIRPQRVNANSPAPGFVTLTQLQVANVGVIVGGTIDTFQWSSPAQGQHMDMPLLTPSNKMSMSGNSTSFVPPGYTPAASYSFILSVTGPATITA